ncbi:MAG: formimidoylglutamase [Taibaiella sp.]|nr:formimidoylglutamase [Taibaiella sp.]
MEDLSFFLETTHFTQSMDGILYNPLQWGAKIKHIYDSDFDINTTDVIIIGCGEWRGEDAAAVYDNSSDVVRKHLYQLYHWHSGVKIADAGNIRQGATLMDTQAALHAVLKEIHEAGKVALLIGGSHDLTLQQYNVFKKSEQMAVAVVADMLINLEESEETNSGSFLMDMLTDTPNYISHYSHVAFQSYYAQPQMLETLDKLRFDFFRLGKVSEQIEDIEPVMRSCNFFSFDMSAVRYSDAPANINGSPNGLTGAEACTLTRFAGMGEKLSSVGIYGYSAAYDTHEMTAKLIAQMIWYFVDGLLISKAEARLSDENEFIIFNVVFTDNDTTFIKSKRTNRWWMKMPDHSFVPCSYNDYQIACNNDIPERWLREQERLV